MPAEVGKITKLQSINSEIRGLHISPSSFRQATIDRYSIPLGKKMYQNILVSFSDSNTDSKILKQTPSAAHVMEFIISFVGGHIGTGESFTSAFKKLSSETIAQYVEAFHDYVERKVDNNSQIPLNPNALLVGVQADRIRAQRMLALLENRKNSWTTDDKNVYIQLQQIIDSTELAENRTEASDKEMLSKYSAYRAEFLRETAQFDMTDQMRLEILVGSGIWDTLSRHDSSAP